MLDKIGLFYLVLFIILSTIFDCLFVSLSACHRLSCLFVVIFRSKSVTLSMSVYACWYLVCLYLSTYIISLLVHYLPYN